MRSEKIKAFLDFVDECMELNSMVKEEISKEEKRQQDIFEETDDIVRFFREPQHKKNIGSDAPVVRNSKKV